MKSKVKLVFLAVAFTCVSILYLSRDSETWNSITRIMNYLNSYFDDSYTSLHNGPGNYKRIFSKTASHNSCIFDAQTGRTRSGTTSKLGSRCKNVTNAANHSCNETTGELRRVNISRTVAQDIKAGLNGAQRRNLYIQCPDVRGRLGNQMFEVAATLGIAHAMNYKPVISPSHPLVKYFKIIVSTVQPENSVTIHEKLWRLGTWRTRNCFDGYNLTLDGHFQAWTYFTDIPEIIREAFTIRPEYLNKAKTFVGTVQEDSITLVGIHVRRGDLLRKAEHDGGSTVADKYYISEAMQFYRNSCALVRFIVCSDDMWWSRSNIEGPDVVFSPFKEPILDMAIMSLCDHTIITSGTFGWWGGWLSGGQVVYLKDFPRPGSLLATQFVFPEVYYPPAWFGLSNNKTSIFPQLLLIISIAFVDLTLSH